jgi:hypothetical protein
MDSGKCLYQKAQMAKTVQILLCLGLLELTELTLLYLGLTATALTLLQLPTVLLVLKLSGLPL